MMQHLLPAHVITISLPTIHHSIRKKIKTKYSNFEASEKTYIPSIVIRRHSLDGASYPYHNRHIGTYGGSVRPATKDCKIKTLGFGTYKIDILGQFDSRFLIWTL